MSVPFFPSNLFLLLLVLCTLHESLSYQLHASGLFPSRTPSILRCGRTSQSEPGTCALSLSRSLRMRWDDEDRQERKNVGDRGFERRSFGRSEDRNFGGRREGGGERRFGESRGAQGGERRFGGGRGGEERRFGGGRGGEDRRFGGGRPGEERRFGESRGGGERRRSGGSSFSPAQSREDPRNDRLPAWRRGDSGGREVDEEAVLELLARRDRARRNKDFEVADAIRDDLLLEMNVHVDDKERAWWPDGTMPEFLVQEREGGEAAGRGKMRLETSGWVRGEPKNIPLDEKLIYQLLTRRENARREGGKEEEGREGRKGGRGEREGGEEVERADFQSRNREFDLADDLMDQLRRVSATSCSFSPLMPYLLVPSLTVYRRSPASRSAMTTPRSGTRDQQTTRSLRGEQETGTATSAGPSCTDPKTSASAVETHAPWWRRASLEEGGRGMSRRNDASPSAVKDRLPAYRRRDGDEGRVDEEEVEELIRTREKNEPTGHGKKRRVGEGRGEARPGLLYVMHGIVQARRFRKFREADEIREDLMQMGVAVDDQERVWWVDGR
eukprot:760251-Hanusia_phi.AAC.1